MFIVEKCVADNGCCDSFVIQRACSLNIDTVGRCLSHLSYSWAFPDTVADADVAVVVVIVAVAAAHTN